MAEQLTWQQLFKDNTPSTYPNGKDFVNPNLIYPGQVLNMPDGSTYTVVKGDTLSQIALDYNKSHTPPEDPPPPPSDAETPAEQEDSQASSQEESPPATTNKVEGDKYDVKSSSYPIDLMSTDGRYGGNYVMFYINVSTDSKLFKDKSVETVEDYAPRDRGDLVGMNMSKTGLVASNAATTVIEGVAAGGFVGGAKGVAAGTAAAGVATVGVAVAASMAPDAKRSQRRLKSAIALHIPNQLSIRYGVQWSEEDTSVLAMANAAGSEIVKAVTGKGSMKEVGGVAQAVIANLALSKGPNAGANSAALGIAANPKKEQVFKGVDFRTFSFDYQFFPRSSAEARNVLNIIEQFKYHMHPEFKDTNNFVYIYPSEFDITYFSNGKENKNLHRHTSCVLTEVNINYTPNGVFTTFPDGMPTQINMTLAFRELALLTKDKIKDGL